ERIDRLVQMAARQVQVNARRLQIGMPEQYLNGGQIGAVLQQVRSKAVSQHCGGSRASGCPRAEPHRCRHTRQLCRSGAAPRLVADQETAMFWASSNANIRAAFLEVWDRAAHPGPCLLCLGECE